MDVSGLIPDTNYSLSAYVALSAGSVSAQLFAKNFGGSQINVSITTTTYSIYALTFTTGSGDTSAAVGVWQSAGSGSTYSDDFTLVATSTDSLLTNGNFGSGAFTPWQEQGASIVSTPVAPNSSYACEISGSDNGVWYALSDLTPNTGYVLTAYAELGNSSQSGEVFAKDFGGSQINLSVTTTAYTIYTLAFTTGATNTTGDVGFWQTGGTGLTYVDNLSVTPSTMGGSAPSSSGITAVALGDIYNYNSVNSGSPSQGDTFSSAWSANGYSYIMNDDGSGWTSGGSYVHGRISEMTGDPNASTDGFTGENLNPGSLADTFPDDYTGSVYELAGTLYSVLFGNTQNYYGHNVVFEYPTIIESTDGGGNWVNYLGQENEAPPFDIEHSMFPSSDNEWGWPTFVQYGQGGSSPDVDDAQTYVYMVSYDTSATGTANPWSGVIGDKVYLARISKADLPSLDASDIEYYVGGDGMSNSSWSSDINDSVPIVTDDSNLAATTVEYDYGLQTYVMNSSSDWFPSSSSPVTDGDSRFEVYTAPHPWGPWTKEMNYGIWGLTAGTFLASNEYTSADGGKAWTEFSGGYNGNIWPYGYMYAPLYFSTGPVDTYQAENATLNDVTVADTYPNYQGTGYVTGFHETGDSITFTINNVNGTGWHIVDIRYADSNNAETLSVAVNGQKVRQIAYLSETGDGYYASQDWADYSKIYWLQNGTNTFTIYRDAGDNATGVDVDSISVAENPTYDEGTNVALSATASASSTYPGYSASGMNDGVVEGYPSNYSYEWASDGQGAGAWAQLSWTDQQSVDKIVLYNRQTGGQVTSGTLTFSDGSSVPVGALQADGRAGTVVTFPTKQITWARFTVDSVSSGATNIGLTEFEAFSPNGDEPTGYWPLNEIAGAIAPDMSGYGNTGAVTDGTWVSGINGQNALEFNGSTSEVEIPNATDPTSFTVSAWIDPSSVSGKNIFTLSDANGPTVDWSQELKITSSGELEAYVANATSGSETVTGTTALSAGTWYQVALTVSDGGQLRLYLDGVEQGTPASVGTMWNQGDRYLVGSPAGSGIGAFDGSMQQVEVFDTQLTSSQVAGLY
jgi:hypothetical protein